MLLGAILGTLFIIVCVNLTNLFLARTQSRRKEIVTRLAIGATRARVFRQLLTESAVLAIVGAVSSVVVAWSCLHLFGSFLLYNPASLANWPVLGFVVVTSLIAVLCFGVVPSWRVSGLDFGEVMQASGSRATHTRSRLGKALVAVQVGLSLALLVGAGLFLRTLHHLQGVEVGFNADHLLLFALDPGFGGYDEGHS